MRRFLAISLFAASSLLAKEQGTSPKEKPEAYPAHAALGRISIGAEYMVHSIPAGNQTLLASDYLVVEVAVFPGPAEPVEIASTTFALRLNAKKELLYSSS